MNYRDLEDHFAGVGQRSYWRPLGIRKNRDAESFYQASEHHERAAQLIGLVAGIIAAAGLILLTRELI